MEKLLKDFMDQIKKRFDEGFDEMNKRLDSIDEQLEQKGSILKRLVELDKTMYLM